MKTTAMTKILMGMMSAMTALGAMAADPVISDVVVRQRWPWSRLVDIDYVLSCESAQRVDVAVTAYNGTTPLTLLGSSLSGGLYNISDGAHRIVWDPTASAYTNSGVLTKFNVQLAPTPVPLYMIIDLTKSVGAAGQIEYVTEADLTNDVWGAWVRNPVTNRGGVVESVIWTGVTNDTAYMTDKLVLRRVPAGSYQMGDTQGGNDNTTLTRDMYVGVFQITQKQWNHVMNTTGGTDTQAKQNVSYYEIRENPDNTDDPAVDWPSNAAVNASSFVGRLRIKTGVFDFDLPTDAQWEYFCRAGTTTYYNDGLDDPANTTSNAQMNALGWYKYNVPTPPAAVQPVGGKQPNAWGLYDTHGNVYELCLDWYAGALTGGDDPKGPESGSSRVIRGGSWYFSASDCRSAYRTGMGPSTRYTRGIGFRPVRALP